MDSLPFALVRPTASLLTKITLNHHRFSLPFTKLVGRCAVCDYVPHHEILATFRRDLETPAVRSTFHPSPNAIRLVLQALQRFPLTPNTSLPGYGCSGTSGSSSSSSSYMQNWHWCQEEVLSMSKVLEETGELMPLHALTMASTLRSKSDALTFVHNVVNKAKHSNNNNRSGGGGGGDRDRGDDHLVRISAGDSLVEVSHTLESILKSPLHQSLLPLLDIPAAMQTIVRSLCSDEARGQRSAAMALCEMGTVMHRAKAWNVCSNSDWERVMDSLGLAATRGRSSSSSSSLAAGGRGGAADGGPTGVATSHLAAAADAMDDGAGPSSPSSSSSLSPFCATHDTFLVFPAMLAFMDAQAPLIVQQHLLREIGRDLFTLITHLHPTNSLVVIAPALVADATEDQKMVLCHLLDDEWRTACRQPNKAAPTTPATSSSMAVERVPIPFPEAYLALRGLLHVATPGGDGRLDAPREALHVVLSSIDDGSFRRDAAGSNPIAFVSCMAVALQHMMNELPLTREQARVLVSPLRHMLFSTSSSEETTQNVLDARSTTEILCHSRLLSVCDDSDLVDALFKVVLRYLTQPIGGGGGGGGDGADDKGNVEMMSSFSGFSRVQLQRLQASDFVKSHGGQSVLDAMQRQERMLPSRLVDLTL